MTGKFTLPDGFLRAESTFQCILLQGLNVVPIKICRWIFTYCWHKTCFESIYLIFPTVFTLSLLPLWIVFQQKKSSPQSCLKPTFFSKPPDSGPQWPPLHHPQCFIEDEASGYIYY